MEPYEAESQRNEAEDRGHAPRGASRAQRIRRAAGAGFVDRGGPERSDPVDRWEGVACHVFPRRLCGAHRAECDRYPTSPVLAFRDIRKAFGSTLAVDGLSLEVREGEVFGLLGPNGAGKSTTIGIATGLLAPDAGSVDLLGLGSPTNARVRMHLGLAPQEITLYGELTARENLQFLADLYGLASAKARVDELLALVELDTRADERTAGFSGGMKRRLNLAAALVHDPQLVLLDEPTAGVDPQSRNRILELVRTLASRGKTILYTTHYMEEAAKICDRIGIVDHGRMLDVGTVAELIARHGGNSTVTVERNGVEERVVTADPVAEVARQFASGGVTGVRIDRADLESVFLALTGRSLRE
jgi:ABC-2 type transport system ATP-binding protein